MYLYIPLKRKLYDVECGQYITVGLYAFSLMPFRCRPIVSIPDLSPRFGDVLRLAFRCTADQLRPYQLKDVIDDYLQR